MCHSSHSAISDLVAPTRSVFPPARPLEVDQNLSPKSWTYDNIHVPEGMRIAAPPNRAMHDSHMQKLNAFLKAVHNKPESLHVAVGVKREVEEILTCIADGQWSRHRDAFADQIVTFGCRPKQWLFDRAMVVKVVKPSGGTSPRIPRSCNQPMVLHNIISERLVASAEMTNCLYICIYSLFFVDSRYIYIYIYILYNYMILCFLLSMHRPFLLEI